MHQRADYQKAAPDVLQSMIALNTAVQKSGLPPELLTLVDYRVSQINGCAFCLDMHSKDLRARGETKQRIRRSSRKLMTVAIDPDSHDRNPEAELPGPIVGRGLGRISGRGTRP